ncbi:hypothetical protein AB0O22_12775 [Streptomyces sp. NPDC091204]|uniref:hypothetical protein n=1 Tax=Streptomyces sp. NPDC091204 TaxID=3155299 RepID=UPI0034279C1C
MSHDRHNIHRVPDGAPLPFPGDATALDVARVIPVLAALAPELSAPDAPGQLRLAQYARAAELGRWIAAAADDLAAALAAHLDGPHGPDQ